MTNFAFLPAPFRDIAEAARRAEGHVMGDPRAACFHARFTLEAIVHWLYRHDRALRMPYDHSLGALLHEPSFQNLLPEAVFQKARAIQKMGNLAVHQTRPVETASALQVVKELHHVCHWLLRTYAPDAPRDGAGWQDARVPRPLRAEDMAPRAELLALEARLAAQNEETLKRQQERDALDAELQTLRTQLAEIRASAEQQPDTHDYSEAETRHWLIDVELQRAGWALTGPHDREYEVTGMPTRQGKGRADYVLWGDDGKPLAVVEAKKTTVDGTTGQQQAKLYADCLEQMHGQRPLIFYSNGYHTWLWDDRAYPPRRVAGFYKKDELERLVQRRHLRQPLDVADIKDAIAGRHYQKRVIGSIFRQFTASRRKALLVMATGTGKTRTAIALVDALQRAGWVKRTLFLADRVSLVRQAVNAFKTHLPESSPVNLVTEKDQEGRVYACTYPTMMGLIDDSDGTAARFSPGHFDLVIIDEAHRSVYRKYGAIFRYFDALLVGLTATPREEVDRNTYELFDLEPGVPTDAYELEQAVKDGFLVPPRVQQVDLKFPREGIAYDALSAEEQAEWEALDWGDAADEQGIPSEVNASAINHWLFNSDTVDKALQHLMQHGHKVAGGDRLAKTIVFARNHRHALFIEERFNHHYPQYQGHFARVIDNQAKYPQSLIDDFSQAGKAPHIALSVDMLDTGIDVPEVANLLFFKPVYSRIKFWQMLGRGTRLCTDLFGPGMDKQDFRVFDFCGNFDFFREHPEGIAGSDSEPLSIRLFRARVQLLAHIQEHPGQDREGTLRQALAMQLQGEVGALNRNNFRVREHLEAVERFQKEAAWTRLEPGDLRALQTELAPLACAPEDEETEARLFDLVALRLQLALAAGETGTFQRHRRRVEEMAALLEGKRNIPKVAAQLETLAALQDNTFWANASLADLEDMRLRLRNLVHLLEKQGYRLVYTGFEDEIQGVREGGPLHIPKMTSAQYEKKVAEYLRSHIEDDLVIHRLRRNEPLTPSDLAHLENRLKAIGDDAGEGLLADLLARSNAPTLAHFVRSLVGMDRTAAQAAFSRYLNDRSLTAQQIRFIEMVIDQLMARGVMPAEALYEPPFSLLHSGGPDALFAGRENVIKGVFDTLEALGSGRLTATS